MGLEQFGPSGGSPEGRAMWAKMTLAGAKKKDGSYSKRKYKKGTPKGGWGFGENEEEADRMAQASPASHDEMVQLLEDHGIDANVLKDCSDEALAEWIRSLGDSEDEEGDAEFDDDQPTDDEGKDKTDPFAEFADDELPEPKDEEEKEKFAEFARRHGERSKAMLQKYCSMSRNADEQVPPDTNVPADTTAGASQAMGDGSAVSTETALGNSRQPKKTTVMHQYSEARVAQIVRREVAAALNGQVKTQMDRFEKFTEEQLSSQKKATIEAFCETRLKAGKILPAELDQANPANLFDRLMRADAKTTIRKFREGKKDVALTELDLQMREIDARPARSFSEKLGSGSGKKPGSSGSQETDYEAEKVEQAFERFSDKFPKGSTKEDLVKGFKIERKYHPEVTAEDYLEALAS